MVAIVSLLDAEHTLRMNHLISLLEQEFGLKGVQTTPDPHLTWLTASDSSLPYIKEAMLHAASLCCKLPIKTTGLGIFPGEKPVLYIPVIRTAVINHFQCHLYEAIRQISPEVGHIYQPDSWLPHLTLALADTTPLLVGQAVQFLNTLSFNWEINLDNLSLLTKHGDKFLSECSFPLEEAKEEPRVKLFSKY
ncbi:2'-5' RNA ligase family protein [Nibribacter ruber]|uniref:2'-5' RNA ligase family protein n=1 Tax=Nibribacter ruber TaxID=2698458 RepID=A0A6P1NQE9_9BACT|nr:2'-5' RNA ligase family protein [Nibribacter ruber]QHL86066.1 2'-5' RNA ligase family protein [Nibribacter ruber]